MLLCSFIFLIVFRQDLLQNFQKTGTKIPAFSKTKGGTLFIA